MNFCATSVCDDCLYTFRSISPSRDWFQARWKQISTKELEVFNPEVEEIRKRRYQQYIGLLSPYVPVGRLLDVGAAYGTGTTLFQERGFNVEALEPEDDKANYIENVLKLPVHTNPIEEFVLEKQRYDLVIFAHCLEHLDDPQFVMSRMKNLLKEETGILYVEVPNIWNFVTWSDALYLTHKSNFTEENLIAFLNASGFEVLEKVWYQHTPDEPWDLGVVLALIEPDGQTKLGFNLDDSHTLNDVRRLYRKNLPLARTPPLDRVLRYSVPYIDHFYATLRFDTKQVVEPESEPEFILFESK